MENRKQFTFYRSYFEAIKDLGQKDQTAVLMAVCAYALDGTEPKLSGSASAVFKVIRPTLDAGRRKAIGGMSGRPGKDSKKACGDVSSEDRKIGERYSEDTGKEKKKEKEKEKEGEKEIEIENECYSPYPLSEQEERFSAFWNAYPRKTGREEALREWMRLNPDRNTENEIIGGLAAWKQTESWHREGGRYIPSASKWLFDQRWKWHPKPERDVPHGCTGLGEAELEAINRVLNDPTLLPGGTP